MPKWDKGEALRPVLYQLCRAGERFEVGDGPFDLSDLTDVVIGRGEATRTTEERLLVDDPWMSSRHAKLEAQGGRYFVEDIGSTNGVLVNGARITRQELAHGDLVETGRTFWSFIEERRAYPLSSEPFEFGTWSTWSPMLARQLRELEREVKGQKHILMSGPEGTGKGFLARTVHLMSGRSGRLVHLDCYERKPKRLAVDLFGGDGQAARLEDAQHGTLFLENVDGLPGELQERLAVALTSGAFTSVGAKKRVPLDVRVLAATRLDVEDAIARGKLNPDLVALVSQATLFLPGLDERVADLGLLLDDFLARARGAQAISRDACRAVLRHGWRMHIKSLSRVIEAAAVLAVEQGEDGRPSGTIELMHLPVEVVGDQVMKELLLAQKSPEALRPPSMQSPVVRGEEEEDYTSNTEDLVFTDEKTDSALKHRLASRSPSDFDLDRTDPSVVHKGANRAELPELPSDKSAPPRSDGEKSSPWAEAGRDRPRTRSHESGPSLEASSSLAGVESHGRDYASAVDPELIVEALRKAKGNVSAAARYLGKPRALVLRWIREFQINASRYRE